MSTLSFGTRFVEGHRLYRPYAIPNVKRIVDGSILRRHFESRSMERKYSEAICELTASTWPAGKLIRLSEH